MQAIVTISISEIYFLGREDVLAIREELAMLPGNANAVMQDTAGRPMTLIDDHDQQLTAVRALEIVDDRLDDLCRQHRDEIADLIWDMLAEHGIVDDRRSAEYDRRIFTLRDWVED